MKKANIQNEEYYDYVAEAFATECKKDTDKLAIASIAIGGAIWAMSGNAIAGIAVGAGILVYSDRAIRQSNRALEFIQKNHIAAPFLLPDRLRDFEQTFGRETAVAQLKQAQDYGLRIAPAAEDCLEQWAAPSDNSQTTPALPAAVTSTTAPEADGLLDRLRVECPEILKLIKAPPIRLVGHQRTGKSSFARKLALLRMILLPGHSTWWATPHMERDNPVPEDLNPLGFTKDGKDFAAIERIWRVTQTAIDRGNYLNQTVVWDEFGRYGAFQNKELLSDGLQAVLQEATKYGYFPILIAHGDQAKWFPGITGLFSTLKEGTVKVESIGEAANDFGEMKPTGRYRVTELEGKTTEFQVPGWLTEDYLLGIVRSRRPAPPSSNPTPASSNQQSEGDRQISLPAQTAPQADALPPPAKLYQAGEGDRETLEKMFSLPPEIADIPEQEQTEPVAPGSTLEEVETYIKERGECAVASIKNWGKTRRKGALTSEEVEDLLTELVGLGKIESFHPDDSKAQWVRWIPTR